MGRPVGRSAVPLLLVLILAGCGSDLGASPPAAGDGAINVASFNFEESALLGEIYAQAIEGAGGRVVRRFDLGPREIVDPALQRVLADSGIEALPPAPAQDRNAFAVTHTTALRHDLASLSDLGPVAGELVLGGPPECPTRPQCLPGLRQVYGLRFSAFVPLDVGGPVTTTGLGPEGAAR